MCGIAGYVERASAANPTTPNHALGPMLERIAHRGPDGSGRWLGSRDGWRVSLGHRRLAIIDVEGGKQPMADRAGAFHVTFNGEIYNFAELRAKLERRHSFSTRSDTEALLYHFVERGTDGIRDLNGMFAFAIWDAQKGELTLARDRAGIKPLYYAPLPDGGLAFSSELASVMRHPAVARDIDPQGVRGLFFSDAIHPPTTLLTGVRKLAPGHFLTWRDGKLSAQRAFWSFAEDAAPVDPDLTEEQLIAQLREKLSGAVKRQLISDVPLGVFLSGGLDSSLVAALAHQNSGGRLRTFSIGFDDPRFDESGYARKVARHLNTEHTEEILNEAKVLEVLDQALDCLDEPMADPSIVPTWLLSRLAARSVKVALGGDGGDELWAGYPTYLAHRASPGYEKLPGGLRDQLIRPLVSALPVSHGYQSLEWKLKRFVQRWDRDPALRHLRWMSNTDLPDLEGLLGPGQLPALPRIPERFRDDLLNGLLALDFSSYMADSVLTKVDRASMAHGLETRPPMLDNEFVAWSFSVPSKWKLRGRERKYLLKRAAEGLLPPEIIHRPKKGFAIPLAAWLRGPLRGRLQAALRNSPLWDAGVLDRNAFAGYLNDHLRMRVDRSKPLWAFLTLHQWMKREGAGN